MGARAWPWPAKMAARALFAKAVYGPILHPAMIGQTYMDAVITPNRSLSERGFIVLIAVVTLANFCSASVFLAICSSLVPFFFCIDLLSVFVSFPAFFLSCIPVLRVFRFF